MTQPGWSPSVVVGIDFGMTCTAIAYTSLDSSWRSQEVIQQWPSGSGGLCVKCPSQVAYDSNGRVVDWGLCDISTQIASYGKTFKLHLDPSFRGVFDDTQTHSESVQHYINYMRAIKIHIDGTLALRFPRWNERHVEYRLSIPTTWRKPQLTYKLSCWLSEAGLINSYNQKVVFSHTEAEAAAVYAAKDGNLVVGDIIMTVDAGGATTDITLLRVTYRDSNTTQVEALSKSEGINVGSTMIDDAVEGMIEQKLQALHIYSSYGLKGVAASMMIKAGFEQYKCRFDQLSFLKTFHMPVPGEEGKYISLSSSEIEIVFDALAIELIECIDRQILQLETSSPNDSLKYIILSGGLGSSNHIKRRLTAASINYNSPSPVKILSSKEPQLVVAKGLVMDRVQLFQEDMPILTNRRCRASYGVLCRHIYDKNVHVGEPTERDRTTGVLWVQDQVDWLIKEGDVIPAQGITRLYTLRLTSSKLLEPFHAHIVMSELPKLLLPTSKHRGPVMPVCSVEGRFSPIDLLQKDTSKSKINLFGRRRKEEIFYVNLRIIVGATGLAFELTASDGRSYTQNTAKVRVVWQEVTPSSGTQAVQIESNRM